MKAIIICAAALALAGCVNLYTRCPGTDAAVVETYQSTAAAAGTAFVVMFPQVMMPSGRNKILFPENLISVPLGCLCFIDVACEAAVDTVCWPVDSVWLSKRDNNSRSSAQDCSAHEKEEER